MLNAFDIEHRHCVVCCSDEKVELTRQDGYCSINSEEVTDKKQLFHGKFMAYTITISNSKAYNYALIL